MSPARKDLHGTRTGFSATIACCTLLLAAGCGASHKPAAGPGANAATGATTTAAANAGSNPAGANPADSKPAGSQPSTSAPETVKVDTTPKFASPSKSAAVQSGTVQIAYRDLTIQPDTERVKVGSTIKWTNYDSVQANVTSEGGPYEFASKDFGEGGTFELKVEKPGVIHYECTRYPVTMNGTIEVVS